MLPGVLGLWRGEIANHGEIWNFATATSVPKPLQTPHPPVRAAFMQRLVEGLGFAKRRVEHGYVDLYPAFRDKAAGETR
jgi:hypothetical protein